MLLIGTLTLALLVLWVEVANNVDVSLALLSSLPANGLCIVSFCYAFRFRFTLGRAPNNPPCVSGFQQPYSGFPPKASYRRLACPSYSSTAVVPRPLPLPLPSSFTLVASSTPIMKMSLAHLATLTHLFHRTSNLHSPDLLCNLSLNGRDRRPCQCLSIPPSCYRECACTEK